MLELSGEGWKPLLACGSSGDRPHTVETTATSEGVKKKATDCWGKVRLLSRSGIPNTWIQNCLRLLGFNTLCSNHIDRALPSCSYPLRIQNLYLGLCKFADIRSVEVSGDICGSTCWLVLLLKTKKNNQTKKPHTQTPLLLTYASNLCIKIFGQFSPPPHHGTVPSFVYWADLICNNEKQKYRRVPCLSSHTCPRSISVSWRW